MSITRIDCQFHRSASVGERASYIALNPSLRPGSLVFAASFAAREGISSQVAGKLALEHFTTAVLDFFSSAAARGGATAEQEISLEVLEAAFRHANTSVYQFGHKLAAGGRMAASLLGLVIEQRAVAAGRVGEGSAYLFRGGELFPFFEQKVFGSDEAALERLIGAHSIVSVEVASVPIEEEDVIVVFSQALDSDMEQQLCVLLSEAPLRKEVSIAEYYLRRALSRLFPDQEVPFAMAARVGPEVIYLSRPVEGM